MHARPNIRRRTTPILKIPALETILVAHVPALARVHVRIHLRLRPTIPVHAPREHTLRARAAVGAASNRTVLDVDGAVRTGRARRGQVRVAADVAAHGV